MAWFKNWKSQTVLSKWLGDENVRPNTKELKKSAEKKEKVKLTLRDNRIWLYPVTYIIEQELKTENDSCTIWPWNIWEPNQVIY